MKMSSACLQRFRIISAAAFGLLFAACGVSSATDATTTKQIRAAVQRSIPYIQKKGEWWIEKKNCVSCHRVNNMVWSLGEARHSGFEVSAKLDEWLAWATKRSLAKNDKGNIVGLGNKEGVAQLLLGAKRTEVNAPQRKELAALLLDGQQENGSWKPGGQLPSQKRPKAETATVSTMWITLALIENGDAKSTAATEKATRYITKSPPGKSIEWHAARLLLALAQDAHTARDQALETIRKRQQPDGGWAWLLGDQSDALGTGLALYALTRAGLSADNASIQRAQDFLVTTQRKDGSWAVKGTKANKQNSVQETAVYWGTTWASLGLMAGLSND